MKKAKASLTPALRSFVEWQLEHYHEARRQLKEYERDMMPSNTPNYSLSSSSHSAQSRPTENVSFKLLSDQYIQQSIRTSNAIERVLNKLGPDDTKLITLVFWQSSHSVSGAALALHMAPATAYRKINAVLNAIAQELGYVSI